MPTLLDATAQTLRALGPRRFSLTAVAETAGVSRGTVHNTFGTRENAIRLALEHLAVGFITTMSAAVEAQHTLADQVAAVAVLISTHRSRPDAWRTGGVDENNLVLLLGNSGDYLMRRALELWTPLVEAAQRSGEVGADLDPKRASEWIVRVLFSFELLPPVGINLDSPRSVRKFVKDHIVTGLTT